MTDAPKRPRHDAPLTVPTYRGRLECKFCVLDVQRRLTKYLEQPK